MNISPDIRATSLVPSRVECHSEGGVRSQRRFRDGLNLVCDVELEVKKVGISLRVSQQAWIETTQGKRDEKGSK